ncbi:MAG TPA: endonuclease domain-containing protein [Verrucomicrobiae bacterium]|nr:endonuclease domain-containing protein [Verrucomicrobiae bacterium]
MSQPIIPYRADLTERAHTLRRIMTLAEVLLWNRLKRKQLCGYDFDRQRPLGQRIVDFYCKELNLAVDVDGSVHDHLREQDERRHKEIETLGVTHLRFWNYEVKNDMESVLKKIEDWIRAEETKRGWPSREVPVFVPRSRATRAGRSVKTIPGQPTPGPSKEGNCGLRAFA